MKIDLSKSYDFPNIFIKPLTTFLIQNKKTEKLQKYNIDNFEDGYFQVRFPTKEEIKSGIFYMGVLAQYQGAGAGARAGWCQGRSEAIGGRGQP